jgi:hypothetical protein
MPAMIQPTSHVADLRSQYRELALAWDAASSIPKEGNKIFDALQAL